MNKREGRKFEKYNNIKDEIVRMQGLKKVIAMAVVVERLYAISIAFEEDIGTIVLR